MKPVFAAFVLLSAVSCKTGPASEPEPDTGTTLTVKYDAWNENITVDGAAMTIVHTQTIHEYDDPTSSVPSGSKTNKLLDGKVTAEDLEKLNAFVDECGFLDLSDGYGAPEGRRYYPYNLIVEREDLSKKVEFRSNPEHEGKPEAYRKLEQYLRDLAKEVGGR